MGVGGPLFHDSLASRSSLHTTVWRASQRRIEYRRGSDRHTTTNQSLLCSPSMKPWQKINANKTKAKRIEVQQRQATSEKCVSLSQIFGRCRKCRSRVQGDVHGHVLTSTFFGDPGHVAHTNPDRGIPHRGHIVFAILMLRIDRRPSHARALLFWVSSPTHVLGAVTCYRMCHMHRNDRRCRKPPPSTPNRYEDLMTSTGRFGHC